MSLVQVPAELIGSFDDLREHLQHLNYDLGVDGALVIDRRNSTWLAYCTDPDGEWFLESSDPRDRQDGEEGYYERIGLDWIEHHGPFRVIDHEGLSA